MTKSILFALLSGISITACQRAEKAANNEGAADNQPAQATTTCFTYVASKDSVSLQLTLTGNRVEGSLTYNFYEKDKNKGTISGEFSGDTLLADYTFQAEGTESVREVAFLKKDNTLIEGYAAMEDRNGKMIFTDKKALEFSKGIVLKSQPCE